MAHSLRDHKGDDRSRTDSMLLLTSQAGVQIMSDVMRREFAPVGIDVITVELGMWMLKSLS